MTGSGKTGLGIVLIEEALRAGIPALIVDPKGDLTNLCLTFPEPRRRVVPPVGRRGPGQGGRHARRLRRSAGQDLEGRARRLGLRARSDQGLARCLRVHHLHTGLDVGRHSTSSVAAMPGTDTRSDRRRSRGLRVRLARPRGHRGRPALQPGAHPAANLVRQGLGRGTRPRPAHPRRPGPTPPLRSSACSSSTRSSRPTTAPSWPCNSTDCWRRRRSPRGRGHPLDIDAMLFAPGGTPRCAIVTTAHLSDEERQSSSRRCSSPSWSPGCAARAAPTDLRVLALHGRGDGLPAADGDAADEEADHDTDEAGQSVRCRRGARRPRTLSTSTTRRSPTPGRGWSGGCRPNATRTACSTG